MLSFGAYPAFPWLMHGNAGRMHASCWQMVKTRQRLRSCQEAAVVAAASTFAIVAGEWFQKRKPEWVDSHAVSVKGRLDNYILPAFGSKPIVEVRRQMFAPCVKD